MFSKKIHLSNLSDFSVGIVILTNWHVVYGAGTVVVIPADRRHCKTQCVHSDQRTDLTVVTINASAPTSVLLGSSSKVVVGDCVLGGRCSGRIGPTVTAGIVGARDRSISDGVAVHFAGAPFLKYWMERRRFMNSQTCDKPKGDMA